MKIRVKDILPEGLHLERDLNQAAMSAILTGVEANLEQASAQVRADITRTGSRIFVRATVKACFSLPCARCLEPAEVRANEPIILTYTPEPLAPAQGHELEPDDMEIMTYRGEEIDLSVLVRDQILLAIPLVALCRPDCRGLCPHCGAMLNVTSCGCKAEKKEGPFARLGELTKPS